VAHWPEQRAKRKRLVRNFNPSVARVLAGESLDEIRAPRNQINQINNAPNPNQTQSLNRQELGTTGRRFVKKDLLTLIEIKCMHSVTQIKFTFLQRG